MMNAVLIAAAALAFGTACAALLYVLKLARSVQALQASEEELQSSLAALIREFAALEAHGIDTATRVANAEQSLTGVADRIERLELSGENRAFASAIDSARLGADAKKLEQAFGLSATEARLLSQLHGKKKRA